MTGLTPLMKIQPFIQAYVFTMLSAVFIGLAQEGESETEKNNTK